MSHSHIHACIGVGAAAVGHEDDVAHEELPVQPVGGRVALQYTIIIIIIIIMMMIIVIIIRLILVIITMIIVIIIII